MMQKCSHIYIVKVLDCFIHGEKLCLVMTYADSGDLQREIDRRARTMQYFTEIEILSYFTQVCLALRLVHF